MLYKRIFSFMLKKLKAMKIGKVFNIFLFFSFRWLFNFLRPLKNKSIIICFIVEFFNLLIELGVISLSRESWKLDKIQKRDKKKIKEIKVDKEN